MKRLECFLEEHEIRGAIFDMDGVVLDSIPVWKELGARYLAKMGIVADAGLGDILFSMSMEQGVQYMKEHYHLDASARKLQSDIEALVERFYFQEVQAKKGSREILELLSKKKIPMVVATSSPLLHVEKALERLGLRAYFQKILTTGMQDTSKYEPKIFHLAAESLGSRPEETLVFEDSLYALETAGKAGFLTVGIYDERGEKNQAGLKEKADLYLNFYDVNVR